MQCGGMQIQKDAIYGVNRKPDVHVLYSWLRNPESGVYYSHFDILIAATEADLSNRNALWITPEVPFQEPMSKSFLYRMDDEQKMMDEHEALELQRQVKALEQQAAEQQNQANAEASHATPQPPPATQQLSAEHKPTATEAMQPPPAAEPTDNAEQPKTEQDAAATQAPEPLGTAEQKQEAATAEASHQQTQPPPATQQLSAEHKPTATEAMQPSPADEKHTDNAEQPKTEQGAAAEATSAPTKRTTREAAKDSQAAAKRPKHAKTSSRTHLECEDADDDDDDVLLVLRLSKDCFELLCQSNRKRKSWLFDWGSKKSQDDRNVCFLDSCGMVLGTATVTYRTLIKSFGCLRSSYAFEVAGRMQKEAWRTRT